jgi:large subunit ribosomal protein L30
MAKSSKKLRVTLKKSLNRRVARHKSCVTGLGLRRIGHTVEVEDTAAVRGMIRKVSYLLAVEEC